MHYSPPVAVRYSPTSSPTVDEMMSASVAGNGRGDAIATGCAEDCGIAAGSAGNPGISVSNHDDPDDCVDLTQDDPQDEPNSKVSLG